MKLLSTKILAGKSREATLVPASPFSLPAKVVPLASHVAHVGICNFQIPVGSSSQSKLLITKKEKKSEYGIQVLVVNSVVLVVVVVLVTVVVVAVVVDIVVRVVTSVVALDVFKRASIAATIAVPIKIKVSSKQNTYSRVHRQYLLQKMNEII